MTTGSTGGHDLFLFEIGFSSVTSEIVVTFSCIDKLVCHYQ